MGLAATRYRISNELRHQSTTTAEGRYRLRDIPRRRIDGEPFAFQIVVAKQGYAGFVSPSLTLNKGTTDKLQVVDSIRLEPGVAMSGIVVDHRGQPVAGARVRTSKPISQSGLSANLPTVVADKSGRFTLHDLQRGMTQLTAYDGVAFSVGRYVWVGSSRSILLQLPEPTPHRDPVAGALNTPSGLLRVGQAAAEWRVGAWSDGRSHKLAEDWGNPIVLYFWGTDFRQSVEALPAIGKLAERFAQRGVIFRAIHRPDADEKRIGEEARRMLALKQAPLLFAFDQVRVAGHSRGMTAQQYGVINYPVIILIDRAGKIAFRSDMAAGNQNAAGVFLQILTDPQAMTEDMANQLVERAIGEEIELVLKRTD